MNKTFFDLALEHLDKACDCLNSIDQDDAYFEAKALSIIEVINSLKKYEMQYKIIG